MDNEYKPESEPLFDPVDDADQDPEEDRKLYTVMHGVQTVVSIAVVMATLLTLWNPRKMLRRTDITALLGSDSSGSEINAFKTEETAYRIGILAGHWQDSPGEVCADGLTEDQVNYDIASLTAQLLTEKGYQVDTFPEFDLGLLNFKGLAMIALYSGSCAENPAPASGFIVGTSLTAQNPDEVDRFAVCISEEYRQFTGLPFSYEVINPDHPAYHIFRDIHPETPALWIEMGSLKTDRSILIGQAGDAADGLAAGIICFLDQDTGD